MIRLRKSDGSTKMVEDGYRYVELLSPDGTLAGVVFTDTDDNINVEYAGTELFDKYRKIFGIGKFTPKSD